jgi:ATP-dependent Lhr-like helicase
MTNEGSDLSLLDRPETPLLPDVFARWFESRGWSPRAHRLELLAKGDRVARGGHFEAAMPPSLTLALAGGRERRGSQSLLNTTLASQPVSSAISDVASP